MMTVTMADNVNRHDLHPPHLATLLLKKFPLEDQGLLLIYGPLPTGARSYPASEVFTLTCAWPDTEGFGVGLLVKAEGMHVQVQYGNALCTLDREILGTGYTLYGTGLPSLSGTDYDDFGECVVMSRHLPK